MDSEVLSFSIELTVSNKQAAGRHRFICWSLQSHFIILIYVFLHWLENLFKLYGSQTFLYDILYGNWSNYVNILFGGSVSRDNFSTKCFFFPVFRLCLRSWKTNAFSFILVHLISNLWGHSSFSSAPKQQLSRNRIPTIWLYFKKTFLPNHLRGILLLWFTSSKAIGSFSSQTWAQRFPDHLWSMRLWYLWMETKCIPDVWSLTVRGEKNASKAPDRWGKYSFNAANAPPALLHQLLMCREATKYGSTLMCECKAAATENRQTCSTCPLQNNESNLCISVTTKL